MIGIINHFRKKCVISTGGAMMNRSSVSESTLNNFKIKLGLK